MRWWLCISFVLFFGPASITCCQETSVVVDEPSLQSSQDFDISWVYEQLRSPTQTTIHEPGDLAWWESHVSESQRDELESLPIDIATLMFLTLKYSNQVKIAAEEPLIREFAITEADSSFDWVGYLDSAWNDSSLPVSTSLQAGGTIQRLNDQTFQTTAGARRALRSGGQLDIFQRMGWQDNNSQFFIPANQATGQLTISYSHPLMRGRGRFYNNSLVLLATIDSHIAHDQFRTKLQNHLLEVARAYWALYLERAIVAQKVKLFLRTQSIVQTLKTRQAIDASRSQLITATSALASRRADLIRSRTAVINAETRLRGLINAPELKDSQAMELLPMQLPSFDYFEPNLQSELERAALQRPEALAAIKQVRAGATRVGIAQHEVLPLLNLVTQAYVNGLRGDSDFDGAFSDQFGEPPSYSVGIQYEIPLGNRLARARVSKRQVELRRLQSEYRLALDSIRAEVDIAVREMQTAYQEIHAKHRSLQAAKIEANTIEIRWKNMIDGKGVGTLNLESLLRAQERVTAAETEYLTAMLTYNLSAINLNKSNGTLFQANPIAAPIAEELEALYPQQDILKLTQTHSPVNLPAAPVTDQPTESTGVVSAGAPNPDGEQPALPSDVDHKTDKKEMYFWQPSHLPERFRNQNIGQNAR